MKKLLFLAIPALICFIGCQPEIGPGNPLPLPLPTDSCRIKTAYYYGGSGGINDTANFIYSGGKLVRVEGERAEVLYAYNGNRVTTMHYFEMPGNRLYRIDSFQYINDTVISRLVVNDYDMYNMQDTIRSVVDFNYNGTKLASMLTVNSYPGYVGTDTFRSDFRWIGDNVQSLFLTSSIWANDSIYYQYDNNPNYFRNISPNFFMADPFFQLYVGLDPHIPLFISRNNAVNYTIYTNVDYPLEYELDSMNHPILIRSGGFDYIGYKYQCP